MLGFSESSVGTAGGPNVVTVLLPNWKRSVQRWRGIDLSLDHPWTTCCEQVVVGSRRECCKTKTRVGKKRDRKTVVSSVFPWLSNYKSRRNNTRFSGHPWYSSSNLIVTGCLLLWVCCLLMRKCLQDHKAICSNLPMNCQLLPFESFK